MNNLLTDEDARRIKSKRIYWEEVSKRENGGDILRQEMRMEAEALGLCKLLWIVSEYARAKEDDRGE